ncbi:MAG: thiamine diphosphokinase [Clostridiales bacterium]|nr:thiamine diphosphokinase [Clostridiales bacterium]
MRTGLCYIVGAGEFTPRGLWPTANDLVLAADGGYEALKDAGIAPHLLLGDMDSFSGKAPGVPVLRFPKHKDDTDMALAIRHARRLGYRRFRLYGASGGRQDHVQANLQLMAALAHAHCEVRLVAPQYTVHAVSGGTLYLTGLVKGRTVSVFCAGDAATGVTLRGLQWEVTDARLTGHNPLGVSNRAAGDWASVAVKKGILLVFVMRGRY